MRVGLIKIVPAGFLWVLFYVYSEEQKKHLYVVRHQSISKVWLSVSYNEIHSYQQKRMITSDFKYFLKTFQIFFENGEWQLNRSLLLSTLSRSDAVLQEQCSPKFILIPISCLVWSALSIFSFAWTGFLFTYVLGMTMCAQTPLFLHEKGYMCTFKSIYLLLF